MLTQLSHVAGQAEPFEVAWKAAFSDYRIGSLQRFYVLLAQMFLDMAKSDSWGTPDSQSGDGLILNPRDFLSVVMDGAENNFAHVLVKIEVIKVNTVILCQNSNNFSINGHIFDFELSWHFSVTLCNLIPFEHFLEVLELLIQVKISLLVKNRKNFENNSSYHLKYRGLRQNKKFLFLFLRI